MRILICEDNLLIALDMQTAIEDFGHKCCGLASRSDECLAMCGELRPDLVLVDIDLADGPTGLDVVGGLSERGIPAIIVSGQTALLGSDHAARAVLSKPVSKSQLQKEIQALDDCREGCA